MITANELRELALSLPEVEERETWGEATFRVRDRIFVMLSPDEHSAGLRTSKLEQDALVGSQPETFDVSAYTGRFGWVTARLETADPEEMRELVIDCWRRTAPKRVVSRWDAAQPSGPAGRSEPSPSRSLGAGPASRESAAVEPP
jgi:hypothetical protein